MTFVSLPYYLLLLVTALVFYLVRSNDAKKAVLLLASCVFVFFAHAPSFLFLAGFIAVNYYLLRRLMTAQNGPSKKKLFHFGIGLNIVSLIIYKAVLSAPLIFLKDLGIAKDAVLVLGMSFYLLQLIGYYYEVYHNKAVIAPSFTDFALTIAFFARISAGPILKLNEQIGIKELSRQQEWERNLSYGIQRILLGLFKKLALADRLAPYVSEVFDDHTAAAGLHIYLAPIIFTVQMYLDFSGFIDIAIGSGRIFGVRLPENFNFPLHAGSIIDFWRRWHMTLIGWLTTYIFYPLSYRYRKLKQKGMLIAVVVTFIVSALWHGLAITFLLWGFCHILFIIIEHRLFPKAAVQEPGRSWWKKALAVAVIWHLVAFANIFFRAESLNDVAQYFTDLIHKPFLLQEGISLKTWLVNGGRDLEPEFNYRLSLLLCFLFLLLEPRITRLALSEHYRIGYVAAAMVLIIVFGYFGSGEQFVYNNF